MQKVKIVKQFMKQKYQEIVVPLHPNSKVYLK